MIKADRKSSPIAYGDERESTSIVSFRCGSRFSIVHLSFNIFMALLCAYCSRNCISKWLDRDGESIIFAFIFRELIISLRLCSVSTIHLHLNFGIIFFFFFAFLDTKKKVLRF